MVLGIGIWRTNTEFAVVESTKVIVHSEKMTKNHTILILIVKTNYIVSDLLNQKMNLFEAYR